MMELPYNWLRASLCRDLAPKWIDRASTPSGLFVPGLDRKWQRSGPSLATVVSQSRLLYVFAEAYRIDGAERYLEAVKSGANCLLRAFRDPEYGGFFWSYAADSGVEDARKVCYGQVFAIFGLAHAYRVTRDVSLLTAALETCEQVHNHFRDSTGSLQPVLEHDFGGEAPYRSQNPLMHLVEALLALDEATQSTQHGQRAANWIDFLFDAAFARGDAALPEFYDTHWQPLATPPAESSEEGCIIPGHQFEWAYLLSKGVELGLPDRYLGHARFALDAGLRFGSDSVHGGIVRAVDAAGKVCDDRKVFWQQTEAIRSLARFHIHHGIQAYEQPLRASLDFYRAHLCDADFGGVYTEVQRDGHAMDPNKGSIWKVDYHTVAMIAELLSLQPDNPAPSPAN